MPKLTKSLVLTVLIALISIGITRAQFQLAVENYDLNAVGAANQNWGVSRADDGAIYIANTMGLLRYDGLVWDLHPLPNKKVTRSVLAVGSRIYTGSYEELGYWEYDQYGQLNYTSLKQLIDVEAIKDQEIWKIKSIGDDVYFQSFGQLFKYSDGSISVIDLPSMLIAINVVDNQLYLSTQTDGVFVLKNDLVLPVIDSPELHQSNIISVSKRGSKLFITTALNGCFTYDIKDGLLPFETEINSLVKANQLNNFSQLDDGRMVFGTIKNGLYLTSSQGSVLYHFNRENSLSNNTVLNHSSFDKSSLWIALDNGLSKVYLDQPTFFEDKTGQLGVVYAVVEYKGKLFLGSNTGLFYIQNDKLHFVEGSQGQVWFLKVIDGDLICGHNSGTFIATERRFKQISNFSGGWTIKAFPNRPNEYVLGTYVGLEHLKNTNGTWSSTRIGSSVMPLRYVEFESPNVLWAAHAYKGLYRVYLTEDGSFDHMVNFKDKGLLSEYQVELVNLNGGIRFQTNEGWMKYDAVLDQLVKDERINQAIGVESSILYSEQHGTRVGIQTNQGIFIKEHILDSSSISAVNPIIQKKLVLGKEHLTVVNSKTIINIVDGFSYVNLFQKETQLEAPTIARLRVDQTAVALDTIVELPYNDNAIRFYFTAPANEHYYYQYRLHPEDSWKDLSANELFLENLKERNYTLEYRTANTNMKYSKTSKFTFEVLPPWYLTRWGYMIIGLVASLIILKIYSYQRKKIKRKELQIKAAFDKKQQQLLEEKELEAQQRLLEHRAELLKSEIKLKSKRLADSAMELGKKNEAFQNLRDELIHNREYINNEYWLKKIIRQINKEIEDKDQWALFEKNFNQVHEEFFKKLSQVNNKLTPKDLKLCAYIKMNLSNKEIAPLMNITVRGVETHRFRLKKKLNLKETNIFEFIKSL